MEEYAERLRTLHRDLSLVLEAVERGLAMSAGGVAQQEPAPERALEPEPGLAPLPAPEPIFLRSHGASGAPRVEVMPAPPGAATRGDGEDRRASLTLPPDFGAQDPPSFGPVPFPPRPSARDLDDAGLPVEPAWIERPDPTAPPPLATQPTAATPAPASPAPVRVEAAAPPPSPADRAWVRSSAVAGGAVTRSDTPGPPARGRLSPLLATALLTGWLVAIALLIALLVD